MIDFEIILKHSYIIQKNNIVFTYKEDKINEVFTYITELKS